MCPISGMVQFLIVVIMLLLACHAVVVNMLKISFTPNNLTLSMYDTKKISYLIEDLANLPGDPELLLYSNDNNIASIEREILISNPEVSLSGSFNITGNFLGKTVIPCKERKTGKVAEGSVDVIVVRKKRLIDTVFTASVATLVSILYINFGCAIDWSELRNILKKPIGPTIGFCGQFIVMPLLSYGIGKLLFPDSPEMQLGMFFTGVSPAGGASNVWAVLLEGNISLSIIMTTISTIAAFGMMPFWLFTLGQLIFRSSNLEVPYQHITTYVIALVVPLAIGYLLQRYLKRVAQFMTRIIKGFSSCLILFIIIFAIVTNLYLFQLFSWKIVVAGMALPWLGYVSGYLLAKLLKQPHPDCLTIAIEVGIQNTGIAIFLLRFALPQPEADLTTGAYFKTAPTPLRHAQGSKSSHTSDSQTTCPLADSQTTSFTWERDRRKPVPGRLNDSQSSLTSRSSSLGNATQSTSVSNEGGRRERRPRRNVDSQERLSPKNTVVSSNGEGVETKISL